MGKKDKDMYMVNHVRTLFDSVDANGNGSINWEEFQSALGTDEMQEVFQQIDIDISEAEGVFHLLDINNSGKLSPEDFITGTTRLRGPAKSLDMTLLMREVEEVSKRQRNHARNVERQLGWLAESFLCPVVGDLSLCPSDGKAKSSYGSANAGVVHTLSSTSWRQRPSSRTPVTEV